jgi:hypothetical protein
MKNKQIETMTVGELKKYLDEFPDETPVVFGYPSRDYWRTELVGSISSAEYAHVKYTDYHQCFQVDTNQESEEQEVLVLG